MERLTWSRPGHIAYIHNNSVYVTWLRCVDGAKWSLAEPVQVQARGKPIAISWSAGSDFMVIDTFGLIQIFSMTAVDGPVVRSLPLVPSETRELPSELNTIVASFWISAERKVAMPTLPASARNMGAPGKDFSPAVDGNGQAPAENRPQQHVRPTWEPLKPQGFQHPIQGAAALLAITRNGLLRMVVELNDRTFREVSVPLDVTGTVLAASFLPHDSFILVAVYTSASCIIVYRVQAEFFAPCFPRTAQQQQQQKQQQEQQQQQQQQQEQQQQQQQQQRQERKGPQSSTPGAGNAAQSTENSTSPPARLAGVPVLSIATSRPENMQLSYFSFVRHSFNRNGAVGQPNELEIDIVYSNSESSVRAPIILIEQAQSLHAAFAQVADLQNPPMSAQKWSFKEEPAAEYPEGIASVSSSRLSVVTHLRNGEIQQRPLSRLAMLLPGSLLNVAEEDKEKLKHSKEICLSPNQCIALYIPSEAAGPGPEKSTFVPGIIFLQYAHPALDPPRRAELALAVATSYAYSVYNTVQADDLLSVVWRILYTQLKAMDVNPAETLAYLTSETQHVLNVSFEPPEDPRQGDRHVIPSPLQRWLIFQLVLDTHENWQRGAGAQLAWLALNLQLTVYSIFLTLRSLSIPIRAQTSTQYAKELSDHATRISAVLGSVRWTTDVICHLSRELYLATVLSPHAAETATSNATVPLPANASAVDKAAMAAALHLSAHSGSFINLILSKTMRYLMINTLRALNRLEVMTERLAAQEQQIAGQPGALAAARQRLTRVLGSPPVSMGCFDLVLGDVDAQLKPFYTKGNVPERTRQALELGLLRNVETPRVLLPIVYRLVKSFSARVVEQTDVPRLYFYNTTWLKIKSCEVNPREDQVDGIRKRVLADADPSGSCTRCGAVTVLTSTASRGQADWTKFFAHNCLCGGLWQRGQNCAVQLSKFPKVPIAESPAAPTPNLVATPAP